jgi:DNA processing protein
MSPRRLSDTERRDWVRLVRTPQIGPLTFSRLIARYGNATAAIEALPDIASRVAKGRRIALPPVAAIEDEIAATLHFGARLVASCEPEFPRLLSALDPPPPLLTLYGNAALARPDAVAIVGAQCLGCRPQDCPRHGRRTRPRGPGDRLRPGARH